MLCPNHGIADQIISEQAPVATGATISAKADIQRAIASACDGTAGAGAGRYALGLNQRESSSVQVIHIERPIGEHILIVIRRRCPADHERDLNRLRAPCGARRGDGYVAIVGTSRET